VKAQLSFLSRAKLVDFEIEKHKLLHKSDEVPPGKCRRLLSISAHRFLFWRTDFKIYFDAPISKKILTRSGSRHVHPFHKPLVAVVRQAWAGCFAKPGQVSRFCSGTRAETMLALFGARVRGGGVNKPQRFSEGRRGRFANLEPAPFLAPSTMRGL